MTIVKNAWLSDLWALDAYTVTDYAQALASPTWAELKSHNKRERGVFVDVKLPTVAVEWVAAYQQQQFRLIDTNIVFVTPAVTPDVSSTSASTQITYRFATPSDATPVKTMARASFVYNRFLIDPKVPPAAGLKTRSAWVGNYFLGTRGTDLVVAEHQGKIVGFLLLIKREATLTIDLIAVDQAFQKQGIAMQLVAFAQQSIPNIDRWRVGTQVSNIPSMRFYEKLGFSIESTKYVLHYVDAAF